eukprot:2338-Heterococcus_DN1.PRE.9
MPPARSTEAALRAEISQLKEQLSAERSQLKEQLSAERCASQQKLLLSKDQLLASKDQLAAKSAALLALKDEVMVLKSKLLEQCSMNKDDAAPSQRKRQCVAGSSSIGVSAVLDKDEILDQILSHVGGGDHLYVAGVNRRWRGRYMQYCAQSTSSEQYKKFVTRYRNTIITESRLLHAKLNGFRITDLVITQDKYADLVCRHSLEPEQVITILRLHGVLWDNVICRDAAFYGRLGLLQWLRRSDCQWDVHDVLFNASRCGSVPMLQWLVGVTKPWPESTKAEMLVNAASCDKLAAAQWLRARGAAWPDAFASEYEDTAAGTVNQCCGLSEVQWAVASGSGWLDWKCEDYAVVKYHDEIDRKQAADVLQWAHANGCPCTCGHQQQ